MSTYLNELKNKLAFYNKLELESVYLEINEVDGQFILIETEIQYQYGQFVIVFLKRQGTARGVVIGKKDNKLVILILEHLDKIRSGQKVTLYKHNIKTAINYNYIGKMINYLCQNLSGGILISDRSDQIELFNYHYPLLKNIQPQEKTKTKIETGLVKIDLISPFYKSEINFVIGEEGSGKTRLMENIITNLTKKQVFCIYLSTNNSPLQVKNLQNNLRKKGLNSYTCLIYTNNFTDINQTFIGLENCLAIAEYFYAKGFETVVLIDDLNTLIDKQYQINSYLEPGLDKQAFIEKYLIEFKNKLELTIKYKPHSTDTNLSFILNIKQDNSNIITGIHNFFGSNLNITTIKKSKLRLGYYPNISINSDTKILESHQTYQYLDKLDYSNKQIQNLVNEYFNQEFNSDIELAKQVLLVCALRKIMNSEIEVADFENYKSELFKYFHKNYQSLLDSLNKKQWSDEIEDFLINKLTQFNTTIIAKSNNKLK
jgi:F0F1-type ATP synthase alpha subunit